jgi:hypothetical protein
VPRPSVIISEPLLARSKPQMKIGLFLISPVLNCRQFSID